MKSFSGKSMSMLLTHLLLGSAIFCSTAAADDWSFALSYGQFTALEGKARTKGEYDPERGYYIFDENGHHGFAMEFGRNLELSDRQSGRLSFAMLRVHDAKVSTGEDPRFGAEVTGILAAYDWRRNTDRWMQTYWRAGLGHWQIQAPQNFNGDNRGYLRTKRMAPLVGGGVDFVIDEGIGVLVALEHLGDEPFGPSLRIGVRWSL